MAKLNEDTWGVTDEIKKPEPAAPARKPFKVPETVERTLSFDRNEILQAAKTPLEIEDDETSVYHSPVMLPPPQNRPPSLQDTLHIPAYGPLSLQVPHSNSYIRESTPTRWARFRAWVKRLLSRLGF